jgi:hypothetical protein
MSEKGQLLGLLGFEDEEAKIFQRAGYYFQSTWGSTPEDDKCYPPHLFRHI